MSQPLFVHDVKNTSWCIVVTENAGHFYFDKDTKQSVWQLDETGLEPETFVANVNFDDLGILFAKAKGFVLHNGFEKEKATSTNLKQLEIPYSEPEEGEDEADERSEEDEESEEVDGNEMLRQILGESGLLPDEEAHIEKSESLNNSETHEQQEIAKEHTSAGLALGYSSLEDDSDEEDREDQEDEYQNGHYENQDLDLSVDMEDKQGLDLNIKEETKTKDDLEHEPEGLDLSISEATVSPEDTAKFIALLEKHRSTISIYDPWFVVEEELLAEFAQDPTFYAVPEEQRESILNQWVSHASSSKDLPPQKKYPTPEVRYFQFLQEHKSQVRKLYYPEFYSAHLSEMKTMDFGEVKTEEAYRRFRMTLNDFAIYERSAKKRATAGSSSNLKVEHVRDFVAKNIEHHKYDLQIEDSGSWFDRWISLCNQCNLPTKLVNDPTNFIVGDEKRFACYMGALQRT